MGLIEALAVCFKCLVHECRPFSRFFVSQEELHSHQSTKHHSDDDADDARTVKGRFPFASLFLRNLQSAMWERMRKKDSGGLECLRLNMMERTRVYKFGVQKSIMYVCCFSHSDWPSIGKQT